MKTLIKGTIRSVIVFGAGFLGYNTLSKEYHYKKNVFVQQKIEDPKPNSVCIVGGGIIGVQSVYTFLKNGYNVDLIERRSEICLENSYQNGANLSRSNFYRYVTKKQLCTLITNTINNLINPNEPKYANRIQFKALLEQNFFNFGINALNHIYKTQGIYEEKLFKLSSENSKLYDEFIKQHPLFQPDTVGYIKGGIQLFETKEEYNRYLQIYKTLNNSKIYPYKEAIGSEEIAKLYRNQFSPDNFQNYYGALLYSTDTNLDAYPFNQDLIKFMQMKYPEQFKLHINTAVKGFIIDERTQQVIGIKTDKDKQLFFEKFVLACGSHTKKLTRMLKLQLPIINVKGYSISIKGIITNQNDIPCIADEYNIKQNSIFISRLKKEYRVCGYGQISGEDYSIDQNLIQSLVHELKKSIFQFKKTKIDIDELNSWAGFRPQSPDDVPIISQVPNFENVFVNTGQGGRGIIWSLISSQKLFELMTEKNKHEEYSVTRFLLI